MSHQLTPPVTNPPTIPAPPIPAEAATIADAITATAATLAGRLDVLGPAAPEAAVTVAAAVTAAHTALTAYLRVPAEVAHTRVFENGLTARAALIGQLQVIAAHVATIAGAVDEAAARAVLAHAQTVTDRFALGWEPTQPVPVVVGQAREIPVPQVPGVVVLVSAFTLTAALVLGGATACDHQPDRVETTSAAMAVHTTTPAPGSPAGP